MSLVDGLISCPGEGLKAVRPPTNAFFMSLCFCGHREAKVHFIDKEVSGFGNHKRTEGKACYSV
jgi:hypothetical protein